MHVQCKGRQRKRTPVSRVRRVNTSIEHCCVHTWPQPAHDIREPPDRPHRPNTNPPVAAGSAGSWGRLWPAARPSSIIGRPPLPLDIPWLVLVPLEWRAQPAHSGILLPPPPVIARSVGPIVERRQRRYRPVGLGLTLVADPAGVSSRMQLCATRMARITVVSCGAGTCRPCVCFDRAWHWRSTPWRWWPAVRPPPGAWRRRWRSTGS